MFVRNNLFFSFLFYLIVEPFIVLTSWCHDCLIQCMFVAHLQLSMPCILRDMVSFTVTKGHADLNLDNIVHISL